MGMPVTVEIVDAAAGPEDLAAVFDYFIYIDNTFSTYKPDSEMMRINRNEIAEKDWSDDMAIIFGLAEDTKQRTNGYFDIRKPDGSIDPSGIVKGWAIFQAAKMLEKRGIHNFYLDVGGDIQTGGTNPEGKPWSIGIRNPLAKHTGVQEIVTTIYANNPNGIGVATSGTYIRGNHIYNPHGPVKSSDEAINDVVSLTVVGPNIYEADRFATAAFAMGTQGIRFIQSLPGFEGYMITKDGVATMTNGFNR